MKNLVIVFMVLLLATTSFGATKHWYGSVDQNFTNFSNWSSTLVFTGTNDGCISEHSDKAPIMYSTSTALNSTRNLYVGGIRYGELDMQGSTVNLGRMEIGADYMLSGVGADGAMTMSGGSFNLASSVLIGSGNEGSLSISGGTLTAGTFITVGQLGARSGALGTGSITMTGGSLIADRAYVAKDENAVGSINLSGTSSMALTSYIFVGDANATATVTMRDSATLTGGSLSLREGSTINFILDEAVTGSRMSFSDTEALSNSLNGLIDVSFENTPLNGTYDLISFAEDMSGTDISNLLSANAAAAGWSLNMAANGCGSILQATIPEPATLIILAMGSFAAVRRKK